MDESFTIRWIIDSVNFYFTSTLISLYCITDVNRRNTTNFTIGWTTNGISLWCKLKSSTSESLLSCFLYKHTRIPFLCFQSLSAIFVSCGLSFFFLVCNSSATVLIVLGTWFMVLCSVFQVLGRHVRRQTELCLTVRKEPSGLSTSLQ